VALEDRERLLPRKHQSPEIRAALVKVLAMGEGRGFALVKGGHWGLLVCNNGCCRIQVNGTPRNPGRHARDILRDARRCPLPDDHPLSRTRR
jgi:hypothetical protein